MPKRQELHSLYQQGVGDRNMDPAFKTTGWWIWAEPKDSAAAWSFRLAFGDEGSYSRDRSGTHRVFGVRPRSLSKTNGLVDSHGQLTTAPISPPESSPYSEGFFVIGYSTRNHEAATAESRHRNESNGFRSQVLFSSDWSNLAPGLYIVVYGSYPTASEANAVLPEIQSHVPDAYVKPSGAKRQKAE